MEVGSVSICRSGWMFGKDTRAHGMDSFSNIPSTVEVTMKDKPKDRGSSASIRFEGRKNS